MRVGPAVFANFLGLISLNTQTTCVLVPRLIQFRHHRLDAYLRFLSAGALVVFEFAQLGSQRHVLATASV